MAKKKYGMVLTRFDENDYPVFEKKEVVTVSLETLQQTGKTLHDQKLEIERLKLALQKASRKIGQLKSKNKELNTWVNSQAYK